MMTSDFGKPFKSGWIVPLALIGLSVLVTSSINAAQAASPKVEKALSHPSIRASEVEGAAEPWERGVKRLIVEAGVSGGVLEDEQSLEKRPEKPSPKGARLSGKEILDRLTAENAGYKWQATGESLNVLPRDLDMEPLKSLTSRVSHYSTRARFATVAIQNLLKERKFPVRPEAKYMMGGIKPKSVPEEREFSCDDKTVIECMNSFVDTDGTRFWHLYFHSRTKSYVISTAGDKEK